MGLKDLFFKKTEEEVEPKKKGKGINTDTLFNTPQNQATIPGVSAPLQPSGNVDYNKHFDGVMTAANLPGPDYHEFSQALAHMASVPLTEDQKYKTVFATYTGMGVDANKLTSSAQQYLTVLAKEKDEFTQQLAQTRKVEVTDKAIKIEAQQSAIEEANTAIQTAQANIQKLTAEKMQAEQSLMVEENNFNNTFAQRINVIQDHMAKINQYLHVK